MNDRIKSALESILEKFQSGEIPEVIAISSFPPFNIPSAKWSLLNRVIMLSTGTKDARGFNQWKEVNRFVKKGAKSIIILAPRIKKEGEDEILKGFLAVPVFRLEDTDGEPLEYQKLELPELPLKEVAESWGISIKAIPRNYKYYGYYSPDQNEIALATEDESVFFHELSHAGHERVYGPLKPGQDPLQEIFAELCAETLCQIVGKTSKYLGNSYRYIEKYAQELEVSPLLACVKLMGEVEKVLGLILSQPEDREAGTPATAVL